MKIKCVSVNASCAVAVRQTTYILNYFNRCYYCQSTFLELFLWDFKGEREVSDGYRKRSVLKGVCFDGAMTQTHFPTRFTLVILFSSLWAHMINLANIPMMSPSRIHNCLSISQIFQKAPIKTCYFLILDFKRSCCVSLVHATL